MNLKEMLIDRFNPTTKAEYVNALKRVLQEFTLAGLWRAGFFEYGAFYGGTALRILYSLPRFSEDLDFTLLKADEEFSLKPYFKAIQTELTAWGFEAEISESCKGSETQIESAFIKAKTLLHLVKIEVPKSLLRLTDNELLKVKFEVDTNPPHAFETEVKYILQPSPAYIKVVSLEHMFAGKLHAVLCRAWKTRVKGRDWYDMVWFIAKGIACPLPCLESRMRQSGHWKDKAALDKETVILLLQTKLKSINLTGAKQEAMLFVDNPSELDVWSADFFNQCFNQIMFKP
jgi:predicted nucleotidyltransferase component of viral defense system